MFLISVIVWFLAPSIEEIQKKKDTMSKENNTEGAKVRQAVNCWGHRLLGLLQGLLLSLFFVEKSENVV